MRRVGRSVLLARPDLRLCLALVALAGCQKIAGIEERHYAAAEQDSGEVGSDGGSADGDAGTDGSAPAAGPSAEQCDEYCTLVGQVCTIENKTSAYPKPDFCTALCPHLQSEAGATKGNNFQCRLASAHNAEAVASEPNETQESCRGASPGGFGLCGSNCESYCQLYGSICGESVDQPAADCETKCAALRSDNVYNASEAFSGGVDSLQCRLAHLSAAAKAIDPHCRHAQIIRQAGDPCSAPPSCNDYCDLVMNVCKGADLQYESVAECRKLCAGGLDLGDVKDTTQDTLGCRVYHTYNALRVLGGTHCHHAGPSGDGHCGRVCPAYCKLAKSACGALFTTTFPGGDADCLKDCASLVSIDDTELQIDLGYDVPSGKQNGNTVQCRLYRTTKAFSNIAECPGALGLAGSPCAP